MSTINRTIFRFDIWEPDGFHPVVILIWKWEPDGSPIRLSFQNQNDNRMSMLSGCHFQIKWIFFKWQPDGDVIRLSLAPPSGLHFKKNDNRMTSPSGCHFILKWQPDGGAIRLSFFLKCKPDGGAIQFLFFFSYELDRVSCEIKILY